MSTAKSIICFFFEHNLPKPSKGEQEEQKEQEEQGRQEGQDEQGKK